MHGNGGGGSMGGGVAWPGMFGMVQNYVHPWDGCDRIAAMSMSMLQRQIESCSTVQVYIATI